jgi:Rad3-related DNA helicase
VLVAVPRDAPSVSRDKELFLAWTRRFLTWLGERTHGRMLVLFTNLADVRQVGRELEGFFRARRIPLWYQGMQGVEKEELSDLFRSRKNSILLGVDTFWYGADFPGETLEYLVLARLPYGVPDRYHHAQCAALGADEQRRRIYMPRALAKFRQGFGRLMRRTSDRGAVLILDQRVLEPRHRGFLRELPLDLADVISNPTGDSAAAGDRSARLVRGASELCLRAVFEHMGLEAELRERGLDAVFDQPSSPDVLELPLEDLPF